MNRFGYARARTAADAVGRLRADPDARLLAGGQSLIATIRLGLAAPSMLIDLASIPELTTLRSDVDGLTIGAMCTHATIAASAVVRAAAPMLAGLADGIGDRQIRNRGTIGGSVANDDPAACWPAAVLAADAVILTDRRCIAADDFFPGLFTTALAADELIVGIRFPHLPAGQARYRKHEQPASRFALVGVAIVRRPQGVRVALTGLGNGVFRAEAAEAALTANFAPEAVATLRIDPGRATTDLHASAEYRAHLAGVMIRRSVADLAGGAS